MIGVPISHCTVKAPQQNWKKRQEWEPEAESPVAASCVLCSAPFPSLFQLDQWLYFIGIIIVRDQTTSWSFCPANGISIDSEQSSSSSSYSYSSPQSSSSSRRSSSSSSFSWGQLSAHLRLWGTTDWRLIASHLLVRQDFLRIHKIYRVSPLSDCEQNR